MQDRGLGRNGKADGESFPFPLDLSDLLGRRTGELHAALAKPSPDPAFGTEPVTEDDVAAWAADTLAQAEDAFARLEAFRSEPAAAALLARHGTALALIRQLASLPPSGGKSRIHGDYHLGQVLVAKADFYIIDFEGEPRRGLEERREKSSPLRDVAGMLRSFDYAAFAALDRVRALGEATTDVEAVAWHWRDRATSRFMEGYRTATERVPTMPETDALLRLFTLQKAFYEIGYEAANRPAWLKIPVRGVLSLLDEETF